MALASLGVECKRRANDRWMIFSPHFKETTTKEPLGDDINKSLLSVLFLVYLERRAKRLRSNRLLEHKEVWSEEKGSSKSSSTREEKRRKEPPNKNRVVFFESFVLLFAKVAKRTRRDQRQRFARDVIRIRIRGFHDARPRRRRERDVDREKLRLTDAEKGHNYIRRRWWSSSRNDARLQGQSERVRETQCAKRKVMMGF